MVKLKLIVLLLMVVAVAAAQEKATKLVYGGKSFKETKKGKEETGTGTIDFTVSTSQVSVNRTPESGKPNGWFPTRIYDRGKDVLIYDFAGPKLYVVETKDSIIRVNCSLKANGKTAVINGYNCKGYETAVTFSMVGPPVDYEFVVWITEDIPSDEAISEQISSALTMNVAMFSFKGTIVKMETTFDPKKKNIKGEYMLEKVEEKRDNKPLEMPWKKEDMKAAIIDSDGQGTFLTYTDEKLGDIKKRLLALLKNVTGNDNPKYTTSQTGYFYY